MQVGAPYKLADSFFEQLFVVVAYKNALIVELLRRCEVLLLCAIIELQKVLAYTLLLLTLLKVQVDDALDLHLKVNSSLRVLFVSTNAEVLYHVDMDQGINVIV